MAASPLAWAPSKPAGDVPSGARSEKASGRGQLTLTPDITPIPGGEAGQGVRLIIKRCRTVLTQRCCYINK